METELHLFFHCNVHCTAPTALVNKVHHILNETAFAERFERLDNGKISCEKTMETIKYKQLR